MRVEFGEFCFDSARRELSRRGAPVHLTPKAMQLLALLLESRPEVLSRAAIYDALWPGVFVDEANLGVLVAEVRAALGDDARRPRFIRTAYGFGYGFIAETTPSDRIRASRRLRRGAEEIELLEGENLLGRDAGAVIRLEGEGISRRHARIVVRAGRVTIEDLGSKNGTYVQGQRIDGTRELSAGDEIRISRELLVLIEANPARSTVTELD